MTDVPNQHLPVIAKDLLIAAIATKELQLSADPIEAGTELGKAFVAFIREAKSNKP